MIGQCTVQEMAQRMKSDSSVLLIDVRTPPEYAAVHAEGAVNMPLDGLTDEKVRAAAAGRKVFFICKSGGRSSRTCSQFERILGEVWNVTGGTDAWVEAGLPSAAGACAPH